MAGDGVFAIGDIHGCADELEILLDQLPLTSQSKIVFLGDYVDRGPDSKRVIDVILELSQRHEVVALKGNHEEMFIHFLNQPESANSALFILNGGSATLASYSTGRGSFYIPDEHLRFLSELQLVHQDGENLMVHAGLPEKPLNEIDVGEDQGDLLWIREPFLSSDFQWGVRVVHGHSPIEAVSVAPNRINLDTGCVYGGFLSAMELKSQEIFQVRKKGGPAGRTYLQAEHSQRIAHRFSGAIQVFVEHFTATLEFTTLNYNEFGMLLRPLDESAEESFFPGEKIKGTIGPKNQRHITFKGEVMRVDQRGPYVLYGIKIIALSDDDS